MPAPHDDGSGRWFLGWDRPPSVAAAEWISDRFRVGRLVDAERLLVVAPGSRAARALVTCLVVASRERGLGLIPPAIVTPGEALDALLGAVPAAASPTARRMAWLAALRAHDPDDLARLVPRPPERGDLAAWFSLAEQLQTRHDELAGDGLTMGDVANRLGQRFHLAGEESRWLVCDRLRRGYERVLDAAGLRDPLIARLAERSGEAPAMFERVALVAAPELPGLTREALAAQPGMTDALIAAPRELADRFDELGLIRPDAWDDAVLDLGDEQILSAAGPADQAAAAMRALAELGEVEASDVVLGTPDHATARSIGRAFRVAGGPEVRFGGGSPLGATEPAHALRVLRSFLDHPTLASLATLGRSPAWTRLISRRLDASASWLDVLDDYHEATVHGALTGDWSTSDGAVRATLDGVTAALMEALGALAPPIGGSGRSEDRPLGSWAEALLVTLGELYRGAELDRDEPTDRETADALSRLGDALADIAGAGAVLTEAVSASSALALLLRSVERESVPEPPNPGAIEALGWLELAFDPAPHAIVAPFNEGVAPASRPSDPLLPDSLRSSLGMADDRARLARDAYLTALLAHSKRTLRLVVGRRSAAGDPLRPSRLLFRSDAATVARRAARLFGDAAAATEAALEVGGRDLFVERPTDAGDVPTRMGVTSFRTYLASPYFYYLRHVLRLEERSPSPRELGAAAFGDLIHDAWSDFARSDALDSTDPVEVTDALDGFLDRRARERFGGAPPIALRLQIELARGRLRALGPWQAGEREAGWRIVHAEWLAPPGAVALDVDGEPMELSGRIDRIDAHETTGAWRVLDYKTGALPPFHARTAGDPEAWKDLQLPLYRRLIAPLDPPGEVGLGYVHIPKDPSANPLKLAPWSDAELLVADSVAEDVVRRIRRREFGTLGTPPARSGILAAMCGQGLLSLDPSDPSAEDDA